MSTLTVEANDQHPPGNNFQAPIFGEAAATLIACNQKLQELGIDDTIKVPRLVVIGDQSTGKSSLIEAISGVTVPRAAGLCTKCPIAINLSHADRVMWQCSIYIEEKYFYDPAQSKVTQSSPLGPWVLRTDVRTTLVKTIYDPAELGGWIDQAQRHLLNPLSNFGGSFGSNLPANEAETFSPNNIRLDLFADGWANLSFVDLPGVITRPGRGQPKYYVDLVENLARQYAKDKNNIIMLTLPMNHDTVNSKSYSIVETEKVHGRTIAVFTKVDLANADQLDQCLKQHFDEESPEEFGFGEHMVMLGNDECRNDERSFFDQEPWNSRLEIQHKLGVVNLIARIREILFEQTRQTLPQNLRSISIRLQEVSQLLQAIPAPPDGDSLPWKLREDFFKFGSHAQILFSHGSSSRNLLNALMEKFAVQITKDKPRLKYKTSAEVEELEEAQNRIRAASEPEVIEVDDGDDSSAGNDASSPKKPGQYTSQFHRFTLEDIRDLNKQLYQSSIGGEIEPKAVEKMNLLSVQHWQKTLDIFIVKLRSLLKKQVLKCIEVEFAHQNHLPLYDRIQSLAVEFQDIAYTNGKLLLDQKAKAEMKTPFTLDNITRQRYEKTIFKERLEIRRAVRLDVAHAVQRADHIEEKRKLKPKLIEESALGPDEWEREIHMSAKSAAYYELASKRFVDNVCQDILTHLIPRIQSELVTFIRQKLGLDNIEANHASIVDLMSENPEREAERRRLITERRNLVAGHEYISNVLGSVPLIFSRESSDTMMEDEAMVDITLPKTPNTSPNKRKAGRSNATDGEPVTPSKRSKRAAYAEDTDESSIRLPERGRSHDNRD